MLFRKLWRTMKAYKAQFISMTLMVALGTGVFVGFNTEWMSLEYNTDNFFRNTGLADYRIYDEYGISEDDLEDMEETDGVKEASRVFMDTADVEERKGDTLSLTVTENTDVTGFQIMKGKAYDEDSKKDILISDKYAEANKIKIGDSLTLTCGDNEFKGKVSALVKSGEHAICVRDMSQLMPDYKTHGFAYISPKALEEFVGMEFYPSLHVITDMSKKDFSKEAEDIFGKKTMIISKDDVTSYAGPAGEIEEGKTVVAILPPIFLLIALLSMVTTMNRIVSKEKIQIGTLKALGFKDRKILRHYTMYAIVVGLTGGAAGIGIGYLIGYMIDNPDMNMGEYIDMPQWKLVFPGVSVPVIIGIIAVLAVIGYVSTKKMLKGNAADTLRPYVPKNIKPLAIENTAFFNRLSFGSRWNMRDTMRHKARTLMSVFGVIGCMVILVAVLGMKDSVNSYIDGYFKDSLDYSSRIYLTEDVTDRQYEDLMEKYDGDSSANIGMDLDNESVAVEIHHSENNMVKFMTEDNKNIRLGDEGIYVCMRLADEYDLEKGDKITMTPIGTNDDYHMEVAGILRNISESFFMSDEYAEKTDLDYKADSIYTATEKNQIKKTDGINTIQSREMIASSFDSFMDIMKTMIGMAIGLGVVLGIVVLYNLGTLMYTERYRELATLKVIGFKDRKIGGILHGQTLWTTIIGIIAGLPLGSLVLDYLVDTLGIRYEMLKHIEPLSYVISIVITLGVALLVSVMTAGKSRKIDMVSSLKGAE